MRLSGSGIMRTHDKFGRLVEEIPDVMFHQTSLSQTTEHGLVTFATPSASALALRTAVESGQRATALRQSLKWSDVNTPFGTAKHIGQGQHNELFDCLEESMVCASFSYLALEVFCNEKIAEHPEDLVEIKVRTKHGKAKIKKPAKSLEDRISTEEKLGTVLPQLVDVDSPKGTRVWEDLRVLQRTRNDIIHLKAITTNPSVWKRSELPKPTVFYRFLTQDVLLLPTASIRMMLYFVEHSSIPEWLHEPMERLDIKSHK